MKAIKREEETHLRKWDMVETVNCLVAGYENDFRTETRGVPDDSDDSGFQGLTRVHFGSETGAST